MTLIKAKPTLYSGTRFRSRLEARWAKFFDAIGREWIYEPEFPELVRIGYQPDFLVDSPSGGTSLVYEIKPHKDGDQPWAEMLNPKYKAVAETLKTGMCLVIGAPGEWIEGKLVDNGHVIFRFDYDESRPTLMAFSECLICGKVQATPHGVPLCHTPLPTGPLARAYSAVRDESWEDA